MGGRVGRVRVVRPGCRGSGESGCCVPCSAAVASNVVFILPRRLSGLAFGGGAAMCRVVDCAAAASDRKRRRRQGATIVDHPLRTREFNDDGSTLGCAVASCVRCAASTGSLCRHCASAAFEIDPAASRLRGMAALAEWARSFRLLRCS